MNSSCLRLQVLERWLTSLTEVSETNELLSKVSSATAFWRFWQGNTLLSAAVLTQGVAIAGIEVFYTRCSSLSTSGIEPATFHCLSNCDRSTKKTKQNTAIIQSSNPESQFLHWNTWISSLLLVVRYTFFQTVFYECKWLQSLYSFITTRLHQILNFVCFSVHITDR